MSAVDEGELAANASEEEFAVTNDDTKGDADATNEDENASKTGDGDESASKVDGEDGRSVTTNGETEGGHKHEKKHKHKREKRKTIMMLVCDPQNDYHEGGTMPIPGSDVISVRIADLILENIKDITELLVSLDTRHKTHISNAIMWKDKNGNKPEPYTIITKDELENGTWSPRQKSLYEDYLWYLQQLEESEKDPLTIWPDHCVVGTQGAAINTTINEAVQEWAGVNLATIEHIMKGTNDYTETYSCVASEVEMEDDPLTCVDMGLIERMEEADRVIICGYPLSHTLRCSTKHIVDNIKEDALERIHLVYDCTANLPQYESLGSAFKDEMETKGIKLVAANEAFVFVAPEEGENKAENDAASALEQEETNSEGNEGSNEEEEEGSNEEKEDAAEEGDNDELVAPSDLEE